ncbi:sugar transporter [Pacificibacter sp. AS14]|uniref:sugar transporter n=1 Tax=Pacificibacter sp. AS14 TaxID=3135785 RepID=UPI00316D7B4F
MNDTENAGPRKPQMATIPKKRLEHLRRMAQQAATVEIRPSADLSFRRPRHVGLIIVFCALVAFPTITSALYLFAIADDQYHSTVGFSIQKKDETSPVELLGGITSLAGSATSDADILYEYIRSQEMVEAIDARLDLRSIYSKPTFDPVFAFAPEKMIEDLIDYWQRVVRIYYDSSTGLIELEVLAFTPEDATAVTQAIFEESSRLINEISDVAREDITRYADEELDIAVERLKVARQALTEFRSRTQIVDPSADIQGQMGLLNTLQAQLAESLIDMDILADNTRVGDTRLDQAKTRIEVIRARIAEERNKLGVGDTSGREGSYATLVSEYERLIVDREFAEASYTAALMGYDAAVSDARQQNRYLAAYIKPTKAQSSQYPRRYAIVALIGLFSFLMWSIVTLVYYSIRDRR